MTEPTYPTEEQLETIRKWSNSDFSGLMEFIHPIWEFADAGYWSQEGDIYRISTAGWSGNEDIIASMQDNQIIWAIYCYQSRRGGHYIFAPMTMEAMKILEDLEKSD